MRTHGTLKKWSDQRRFGFIEPATRTEPVFVHIKAFTRDGTRPAVGELLSFSIETDGSGR